MSSQPAQEKSANPEEQPPELVGQLVQDRFKVLKHLASGGMGVVYKAEQVPLGRPVALKVLERHHNPSLDESFSDRFFLEAAAVAKLSHPNTVVVYDYGRTEQGLYYIAMEFVEGRTLKEEILDNGPLDPGRAIHTMMQVCGSLREAHDTGLVHRDLKPANIMLTQRGGDPFYVKVLDFGLVKELEGQEAGELTKSGLMMGSPRYMSPEQVRGQQCDRRTDIYSLGAVLYHCLTGAPPFAKGSQFDALAAHVHEAPPPLKQTWKSCPANPSLEAVVMRCLEKKPENRFQTMNALMHAMRDCMQELGEGAYDLASSCQPLPESLELDSRDSIRISGSRPTTAGRSGENTGPTSETATPVAAEAEPEGLITGKRLALLGIAAVIGVGVALIPLWGGGDPEPDAGSETAAAPTTQATSDTEASAGSGERAPSERTVQLISEPAGARVTRDGMDIGDTPLTLNIPRGEQWRVEISLSGYESRQVQLGAGQGEVRIRLSASAAPEAPGAGAGRQPPFVRRNTGGSSTQASAGSGGSTTQAAGSGGSTTQAAGSGGAATQAGAGSAGSSGGAQGSSSGQEQWPRQRRGDNRDPWAN